VNIYTRYHGVISLDNIPPEIVYDLDEDCRTRFRYGHQTNYSVHSHQRLVASLAAADGAPSWVVRACRYHDVSEGLLGDMQKPLRDALPPGNAYEEAHRLLNLAIGQHLGLEEGWAECPDVRKYDDRAFQIEVQLLFPVGQWEFFLPVLSTDMEVQQWEANLFTRSCRET
jgi:hypothetical protein